MNDTWLESSDEPPRRSVISPHDLEGRDISGMDPTVDWAGGGLVSTASDLAALLRGLTRGDLVSDDTWTAMTRWQAGPAGYYDAYGLGLSRYQSPTATFVATTGSGAFAFWS